jgi:hypothetical protein
VQTVGAYGAYKAATVAAAPGGKANCTKDGDVFARDSVRFLAHSTTNAAYPSDLYYMILREDFADFEARGCPAHYLGEALARRLTRGQIRTLAANVPAAMAQAIRGG